MSVDEYDDSKKAAILSATNHIKTVIKTDILASSVASVCGVSPQEVISPMSELIYAILACSQWGEVEGSISAAINSNQFKLGDEIRSILFEEFKKCTVDGYPPPNFESMIADIWNMHQTDDTGAIAGGDTVLEFAQKYSALKTTHIR